MKKLSLTLAAAILVFTGSASAANASGRGHSPFDAIWNAIHRLQYQVAHIPAGSVGPQGPQGPIGADGAQGIQGEAGSAGIDGAQGPAGSNGTTGEQGAQGIQGPPGADGAQGPQGPQGVPGTGGALPTHYVRTTDVVIPPQNVFGGFTGGYATCDAGDALLSGGARLTLDDAKIMASYPFGTGDWYASASNQNNIFNTLTIFALCADTNP